MTQRYRNKRCGVWPYKIRYRDRIAADLALSGAAGDVGNVRSYFCGKCKGFHHTSKHKRGGRSKRHNGKSR